MMMFTLVKNKRLLKKRLLKKHIYFTIRKTPSLNKKINMHAYIINMYRITLKYTQNSAFTNGTP